MKAGAFDNEMPKISVAGERVAVVAARFNEEIVSGLLAGCLSAFEEYGLVASDAGSDEAAGGVNVFRVPGAYELPWACQKVCKTGAYRAVVALGAVVRGDTPHFDFVSDAALSGCTQVSLSTGVPVTAGIVTTNTYEQARFRSSADENNRGRDAALAAIELVGLAQHLEASG